METSVSLYKVKEDAKEIIKKLGYAAKDAVYCSANIVERIGYTTYIYPHEKSNLELFLKNLVNSPEFEKSDKTLYVWSGYEGPYRYVYVGFFKKSETNLTELVTLTIGVAQQ